VHAAVDQQQTAVSPVAESGAASSGVVAVQAGGQQLGPELAGCWVGVLRAAAAADLAMAQLGVHQDV
jgi:hypothetical protein